ncbi:cell wall protein [Trichoderma novae-zelandiae]
MKTASLFFAASMAVAAAAKGLTDVLPKCALDCAQKAVETADCTLDDTNCICADQATYQAILQPAVDCMVKACGQEETLTKVAPAVVKFCVAAMPKAPAASSSASASSPAATKTTHAASSKAASEASSLASPAASETSSEASKSANPEKKWTSDQPSEVPETTAGGSPTAAESEQPSSTTAPSSAAAAGAAGPMVTAALLVAGAVAML